MVLKISYLVRQKITLSLFILVYFYNFGWKDYGVASLTTILDMVKVMAFALQEGRVAVHCHAGLGRTGMCSTLRSTEPFF